MNTYYMVDISGHYIPRTIYAHNKQEGYEQLSKDEQAKYYLLSEAEYERAFGGQEEDYECDDYFNDDVDECGFNPYLGCYDYDE